mmetsp:Transcript_3922/g.8700  ORF Transcript_3922/g.8700 Transcript_3922/m.8700 type:complete len:227 (-) Transcript_3922:1059-1739(-)
MLLSVSGSFTLITEQKVSILQRSSDLITEKVNDEGGREIKTEGLIVGKCMFRHNLQTVHRNGEEEPSNVIHPSTLVDGLTFGSLKMGRFEVVSRSQIGNQRSLSSLYQHGTRSSRGSLILHVMRKHTIGGSTLLQLLPKCVGANTSHVGTLSGLSIGIHDPLSYTNRVLGGSTSNVLGRIVVDKLFVDGNVLFFGEDGIVHFDIVFVKNVLADLGGDVEEGVSHSH